MAVPRLSTVAATASLTLLLLLLLSCTTSPSAAQSYVPQPAPFTTCPPGQQQITVGTMDTSSHTLFPYQDVNTGIFGTNFGSQVTARHGTSTTRRCCVGIGRAEIQRAVVS